MEFSDFTIRLILILIPGAIATLIVEAITIHKKWAPIRFFVSASILGVLSFAFLQILYWASQLLTDINFSCEDFKSLQTWSAILQKNSEINPSEIVFCIPVSVIVGFFISYLIQHKILYRVAWKYNVSSKYGDDSLYYHYLNKNEVDWVYVRDKTNGLTYRGQVNSFSEDSSNKEILLNNVTVYDYVTSKELYSLKSIYIQFHNRDVSIELPNQ